MTPGLDNIQSETLKNIARYISESLAYIVNLSMETGHFPTEFRHSVVFFLYSYKSEDTTAVNNYRPVSLIKIVSKIYEKIIKVRISNYLKKYDILSDMQYEF